MLCQHFFHAQIVGGGGGGGAAAAAAAAAAVGGGGGGGGGDGWVRQSGRCIDVIHFTADFHGDALA